MADDDAGSSQDNSSQDSSQDNSSQQSSSQDSSSQDAGTTSTADAGTSTPETADPAVQPDPSDATCVENSSKDADQNLSQSAADGSDAGSPSCPESQTGDLGVTVTDSATGQPISGADVQISGPTSSESGTDDSGTANFTGIPAGSYSIAVTKDGYSNGSGSADVSANQSNTATVSLTSSAPATGDLAVSVTDIGAGQPLSGASVQISGPSSPDALTTDGSGTVTFNGLQPGQYSITASKDGYTQGTSSTSVGAGETDSVGIGLTANTGNLGVSVSDSATNQPLSGASVQISGPSSPDPLTTDGSGTVIFNGLQPGQYSITASKDGYTQGTGSTSVGAGETDSVGIGLTLTAGDLEVSVTDSVTNQPLSGAHVELSGGTVAPQDTDGSGAANFTGIPEGSYSLAVTKDGYSDGSGSASVSANQSNTASVALTSTAPATGDLAVTVTDSATSKPITGAHVELSGGLVGPQDTDGSGQASFPGLAANSYNIAVTKDGYSDGSGNANVAPNQSNAASVALTPWTVTLTVDGVASGDKATVGGLIVRNFDSNNAPRKKITISAVTPAGVTGNVTLQCDSAKVKFFDAATGGSQIALDGAANAFAAGSLPKDVFAEGADASDSMRDINVWLDIGSRTKVDAATLTVLWLDKPVVNLAGTISANNAKKAGYQGWTKSGTLDLGLQEYNANFGARMGWGSEASAKVHPAKFNYPGNDLKLERDFDFNDFNGNTVMSSGTHSATLPPGNDTGPAAARDDNPDPDDTIYDWDAAGLGIPNVPVNTIQRTRNNMIAFASITVEGKSVRCSEKKEYFIAFTQVQTAAPSGATWIKKDPPDVAGDNQAGDGTIKTTWDLK